MNAVAINRITEGPARADIVIGEGRTAVAPADFPGALVEHENRAAIETELLDQQVHRTLDDADGDLLGILEAISGVFGTIEGVAQVGQLDDGLQLLVAASEIERQGEAGREGD